METQLKNNETMAEELVGHDVLFQLRNEIEYFEGHIMAAHGDVLHVYFKGRPAKWYSVGDMKRILIKDKK